MTGLSIIMCVCEVKLMDTLTKKNNARQEWSLKIGCYYHADRLTTRRFCYEEMKTDRILAYGRWKKRILETLKEQVKDKELNGKERRKRNTYIHKAAPEQKTFPHLFRPQKVNPRETN